MDSFIERVRGLLVGKTVIGVEEVSTPSGVDPEECIQEGIKLLLDDGSNVCVAVDYEDIDFLVYTDAGIDTEVVTREG